MAWTAPMTAVAGAAFTLQQFNTYVRDNLLTTAPGIATSARRYFVGTGANAIAERTPTSHEIATSEVTTTGSYTDLPLGAGPTVTVTTGASALVFFKARFGHATANTSSRVSVAVSGATTIAADNLWCLLNDGRAAAGYISVGTAHLFTGLTPGSNTFTMKYSATNGTYINRFLSVLPL